MGKRNINYIQYGEGADVLLLHGWGQNIEMMKPLGDVLVGKRVTILDFPGFGKSYELVSSWSIEDYTKFIEEFVQELDLKNLTLIGHSFGGRVAISYASRNPVEKLILFGAPCVSTRVGCE